MEYTVNHSEASAIFLQGAKFPQLAKAISAIKKNAKVLVYWGEADQSIVRDIEKQVSFVLCIRLLGGLFVSFVSLKGGA